MGSEPVEGAQVSFTTTASTRVARGKTDAGGNYTLTTFSTGDGAIAGDHVVTIIKAPDNQGTTTMTADDYAAMMEGAKDMQAPGQDQEASTAIPSRFANPEESGLTRTVVAGEENIFDFDLSE